MISPRATFSEAAPAPGDMLAWLRETDSSRLEALWEQADRLRRSHVGDEVHLRGLIEVSNHCRRLCHYCGLRAANRDLPRYRMTAEEVLDAARLAVELGYGTVVMQAGEDEAITRDWMADVVRQIKGETPLAVTLSLGERSPEEFEAWRAAGADRYLLRFETSDPALFERIHPSLPGTPSNRLRLLQVLRDLDYEIGSGVMIGIPGQTYESLARDIALFRELDLDMIGCGPFIAHPETPLHGVAPGGSDQVPPTEAMAYKVIALARMACPLANIPATTALATLNRAEGRELGLQRGANVLMPNLTPIKYRQMYEIYPGKVCVLETAEQCHGCIHQRLARLGRPPGRGRGDSARRTQLTSERM